VQGDNQETCDCISEGDVVEHIMNTDVFGVVIGFMGSLTAVRVSPSLATMWFQSFELRPVQDDGYNGDDGGKEDVPESENVIDFTKARDLRTAKTKGAA
jgi:hypothetical protein